MTGATSGWALKTSQNLQNKFKNLEVSHSLTGVGSGVGAGLAIGAATTTLAAMEMEQMAIVLSCILTFKEGQYYAYS